MESQACVTTGSCRSDGSFTLSSCSTSTSSSSPSSSPPCHNHHHHEQYRHTIEITIIIFTTIIITTTTTNVPTSPDLYLATTGAVLPQRAGHPAAPADRAVPQEFPLAQRQAPVRADQAAEGRTRERRGQKAQHRQVLYWPLQSPIRWGGSARFHFVYLYCHANIHYRVEHSNDTKVTVKASPFLTKKKQ